MLSKFKIKQNYFKNCFVLKIILDQNFDNYLSLKDLLENKVKNLDLIVNFKIQIILSSNSSVIIKDDLFDLKILQSNIEFILNKNSELEYQLNSDGLDNCKFFCGDCYQCKKSEIIQKQLSFNLVGQHSSLKSKISLNGAGSYFFDLKTIQNHQASCTKSDLILKSALSQNSNLKNNNLVKVTKNLSKVQANQVSKTLLLSNVSRTINMPKLEVESDDVVCKHGAAISKIDKEHLFYLQSRGINYCDARQILVDSFLKN